MITRMDGGGESSGGRRGARTVLSCAALILSGVLEREIDGRTARRGTARNAPRENAAALSLWNTAGGNELLVPACNASVMLSRLL